MSKTRKNLLIILCLCTTLAIMTWYDLRPQRYEEAMLPLSQVYMARATTPVEKIPMDNMGIVFAQGTLAADGQISEKSIIEPQNFPQRELGLYFTLATLPDSFAPVADTIAARIKTWDVQGNEMGAVYINYTAEVVDWDKLAIFVKSLKTALHGAHRIDLVLPRQAITDTSVTKTHMQDLTKTIATFVFDLDADTIAQPEELLARLNSAQVPFQLILPIDTDMVAFNQKYTAELGGFNGFISGL